MRNVPVTVGMIVESKMGRDRGRHFIVVAELDPDFVWIADGGLRGMERPKKKRRRHLRATGTVIEAVREAGQSGRAIENHEIRSWLNGEEK